MKMLDKISNENNYVTKYVFGKLICTKKREVMFRIQISRCDEPVLEAKIGDVLVVRGFSELEFFKIIKIMDFDVLPANLPVEEVMISIN